MLINDPQADLLRWLRPPTMTLTSSAARRRRLRPHARARRAAGWRTVRSCPYAARDILDLIEDRYVEVGIMQPDGTVEPRWCGVNIGPSLLTRYRQDKLIRLTPRGERQRERLIDQACLIEPATVGWTTDVLADKLRCSPRTISNYAEQAGVERPQNGQRNFVFNKTSAVAIARVAMTKGKSREMFARDFLIAQGVRAA
ncbi:MAG: hypothetical protein AAF328_01185 [Planctomycetota bacterium]